MFSCLLTIRTSYLLRVVVLERTETINKSFPAMYICKPIVSRPDKPIFLIAFHPR